MRTRSQSNLFMFLVFLMLNEPLNICAEPSHVYNGRAVGSPFVQLMKCGAALYADGKYTEANAQFVKAVRLSPKNPDALSYCAETCSLMGNFDQACKYYLSLVKIDPKNEDTLFNCAEALGKAGKAADALLFYRRALAVNPKDEAAYLSCGRCLESLHRQTEALAVFRKSIVVNHGPVRSTKECGRLLLLMNKPKDSIPYFEKASALSNDESIWLQWSTAFVMLGQNEKAINICRDYERRFPELEHANIEMQKRVSILQTKTASQLSTSSELVNHSYINEINAHRLKCAMPIAVYITPGSGVKYWNPEFDKIMRLAFWDWTKSSGNLVSFKFVDSPQAARIICSWTANPADMPKYAAGVTNLESYSGAFLERARIKIFTDSFKCPPSDSIIRSIAVHEIGHALGIDGHSGLASDIMYFAPEYSDPKNSSEIARAISERDVSTLRQMYEVTHSKTSQAPSRNKAKSVVPE